MSEIITFPLPTRPAARAPGPFPPRAAAGTRGTRGMAGVRTCAAPAAAGGASALSAGAASLPGAHAVRGVQRRDQAQPEARYQRRDGEASAPGRGRRGSGAGGFRLPSSDAPELRLPVNICDYPLLRPSSFDRRMLHPELSWEFGSGDAG